MVEIKKCSKHGDTIHVSGIRSSGTIRWRCRKCSVDAVTKRRKVIKEKAIEYKGGKCSKCDYDKCKEALEFHHTNLSEKEFSLGTKGHSRSWERIKKELDKCVMLCANCHREEHNK